MTIDSGEAHGKGLEARLKKGFHSSTDRHRKAIVGKLRFALVLKELEEHRVIAPIVTA